MGNYILEESQNTLQDTAPTGVTVLGTPIFNAVYSPSITKSDFSTQDLKEPIVPEEKIYTPQNVKARRYQLYKSRKES